MTMTATLAGEVAAVACVSGVQFTEPKGGKDAKDGRAVRGAQW